MAGASLTSKCIAEFVGTFLLILTVGCNVKGESGVFGAVSIASVLMVSIYALGGISGANFNPAVSFTIGLSTALGGPGNMDWGTVSIYCVVQLVAGVTAGFTYAWLFGSAGKDFTLGPGKDSSGKDFGIVAAGLSELLYTSMLCFVVMNVAVARKNAAEGGQYFGLAIGFVIVAGAYGAGAVSGGCFNPAVAVGIDVSSYTEGLYYCLPYMAFEFLGAALATGLYMAVRPEDFGHNKSGVSKYVSEVLGTYILVLTVGLNVLAESKAAAFSIAASLMCMIYALGDVSGAHFNPAVTLAILLSGKCPDLVPAEAIKYVLAQIVGGVCAGFTYRGIYSGHKVDSVPIEPQGKYTWPQVALAEMTFTFVLCFVVLGAAVSAKTKTTQFFGLAIGSCVTVGGLAIGGISGGSLNPAVSFGLGVSHALTHGAAAVKNAAAYSALELCGAGLAALVMMLTHADDKDAVDESTPLVKTDAVDIA